MTSPPASPNRDRLVRTARLLRPLLADLVFVGGQVAELLVTDPAAVRVRPTDDVDVIASVATASRYHDLQQRLAELGFHPDTRPGAPLCRTRTHDGLVLDAMPLDEAILGFTNPWYPYAIETAAWLELEPGLSVRAVIAPAFLATKWAAFENRGADDPLTSHDLEDVMTLVAGRPTVVNEVRQSPDDVRAFITAHVRAFLQSPWAEEIVESAVPDARHVPGLLRHVRDRLRELAQADD